MNLLKVLSFASSVCILNIEAQNITIKGKIQNVVDAKVYIASYDGTDIKVVDSAVVKGGVFTFKNKNIARGMYKFGLGPENSTDVILGKENIEISFDAKNLQKTFLVKNSPENEGLKQFNKTNENFNAQIQEVEAKAQEVYLLRESNPEKFSSEINKLQKKVDSLSGVMIADYNKIFIKDKSMFISKYVMGMIMTDTTKRNKLFKDFELKDEELPRSNYYAIKTQMYYQRYTKPEIPEYQIAADEFMNNLPKSIGKAQIYKTTLSLFAGANLDYYGTVLNRFKKEYADDAKIQEYLKKLPKRDLGIGDEAPDLEFSTPEGKLLKLSSLKGQVVLLDFWASWCGPCRMENPNVVRVYNKYKDKGFTVLGVSLDQDKNKWVGAIAADGLNWNHISDLKGWGSDAAKIYGVRSIPQTYLLDSNGKILAKNLRGEMLEQKLQEIFK
ncbi:MAG: TlpA disulfide reductase family protein [Cytophagales bacterium]